MSGTLYIIASDKTAGLRKATELRDLVTNGSLKIPADTTVVVVLNESDMRGRKVTSDDTALVCGDWSSRQTHEIRQLVEMFNSRRDGPHAAVLTHRAGEAPQVEFLQHVVKGPPGSTFNYEPIEVQTLDGNKYSIGIETSVPPAAAVTTTTSSAVAWGQVLDAPQQRIMQDALDSAKRERAISADMREQVKKAKAEVDQVRAEMKELRSWLSGVQPVEDTEIPGIFWCGVCGHRLGGTYEHLDGCPATA